MSTPGRSLTSREMTCLSDCARRYIESAQVREETKLFALWFGTKEGCVGKVGVCCAVHYAEVCAEGCRRGRRGVLMLRTEQ